MEIHTQLLMAYSDVANVNITSVEELAQFIPYKSHFDMQRTNFYSIETLKEFERDNLPPDSTAFESFKNEVLTAVFTKYLNNYNNSFERLQSGSRA